jgi:hypothetical protein
MKPSGIWNEQIYQCVQRSTLPATLSAKKILANPENLPAEVDLGPLCFIWFVNSISVIFDYVHVLFYANHMKLFFPVKGFQDCMKFQLIEKNS